MFTRVLNSQAVQRAASFLVTFYLRFALSTTRWTLEGEAHLAPFVPGGKVVVAFWHECLPLMPAVWQRVRRQNPARVARVLVSRHRDGKFIASVLAGFGVAAAYGSSAVAPGKKVKDRGGASALRTMLATLADDDAVVMTPDGPRGPARRAAPGVAQLAAASGAPVLPMAARIRPRLILNSWDRMIVPLPWARGALVCLAPVAVAGDAADAALAELAAALDAAAARAETLCPP